MPRLPKHRLQKYQKTLYILSEFIPADVSWLVGIVAAVVVKIAHPQFRDASAVFTSELHLRIAFSVIWNTQLIFSHNI